MGVNLFYQSLTSILTEHQRRHQGQGQMHLKPTRPIRLAGKCKVLSTYDMLGMDVNNLIYGVAHKSSDNEDFLQRMEEHLTNILRRYAVSKDVFLAVDGPAPRAKLILQRKRRYARANSRSRKASISEAAEDFGANNDNDDDNDDLLMAEEEEDKVERGADTESAMEKEYGNVGSTVKEGTALGIDANQFTPGTVLMDDIKETLCRISDHALRKIPGYDKTTFCVSGADQSGEGEYKCMWHIVQSFREHRDKYPKRRRRALVIGSDSDLILFALQASHLGEVDVLKMDSTRFGTLYNVRAIRSILLSSFPRVNDPRREQHIIDDFCFLTLLSGNDYVPKLRGFEFLRAWSEYISLRNSPEFENVNLVNGLKTFHSKDTVGTHDHCNMKLLRLILQRSAIKKDFDTLLMHPKTYLTNLISKNSSLESLSPPAELIIFDTSTTESGQWKCDLVIQANDQRPPILVSTATGRSKRFAEALAADLALTVQSHELCVSLNIEVESMMKDTVEEYLPLRESVLKTLLGSETQFPRNEELGIEYVPADSPDKRLELDHYLRGIFWTLHYLRCQCCDPNYYYPYVAPNSLTVVQMKEEIKSVSVPVHPNPFSDILYPLEFCVAMLPPGSRDYVPVASVGRLLDPDFDSDIKDMFHGRDNTLKKVWQGEDALTRLREAVAKQLNSQNENKNDLHGKPSSMRFQPPVIMRRRLDGTIQREISKERSLMVHQHLMKNRFNISAQHTNRTQKTTRSITARYMCTWMSSRFGRRCLLRS